MNCKSCTKTIIGKVYPNGLCQGCYNYFRKGGRINPIPEKGKIETDYRGYIVCHICGRAYVRLGSHIKESHNMTIHEYKQMFELCECCKTTEKKYSELMREYAYENDMPEQLIETGYNTRVKKGENEKRRGKKARRQECYDKKARMINYHQNKKSQEEMND